MAGTKNARGGKRAAKSEDDEAEEVEEAARQAADEVGLRLAEIAARLSGWGSRSHDVLVDAVGTAQTADEKGRSLEELCSQLFASGAWMPAPQFI